MGTKVPNPPSNRIPPELPPSPPSKKNMCIVLTTPEWDKLAKIAKKSKIIGEFLDWLDSTRSIPVVLSVFNDNSDRLMPCLTSVNELLAEYFEIDLTKVEQEKQAILDHFRSETE